MLSRYSLLRAAPIAAALVAAALVATAPAFGNAQSASPARSDVADSAQMMAAMASSVRILKPADFLLSHRADLLLTPPQIAQLTALAAELADSSSVRSARLQATILKMAMQSAANGKVSTGFGWGEPVDEAAIRSIMKQQALFSEEGMINLARDRHAAAAILTPTQIAMIPQLESADMMNVVKH